MVVAQCNVAALDLDTAWGDGLVRAVASSILVEEAVQSRRRPGDRIAGTVRTRRFGVWWDDGIRRGLGEVWVEISWATCYWRICCLLRG